MPSAWREPAKCRSYRRLCLYERLNWCSSVFLAHAKTLEGGTAKYPIRRVVYKSFTIPHGYRDINQEKLFYGQLPTRTVVGLVSNRAFNGHSAVNAFNIQHFNLNEIALYLDGQQQHAVRPIQLDYGNDLYIRAYDSFFCRNGKALQRRRTVHHSRRLQ